LRPVKKIAFAFPFDGGAKLDVAARAELASLKHLHRRITGRRGDDCRDDVVHLARFGGTIHGHALRVINKATPIRHDFRLIGRRSWNRHGAATGDKDSRIGRAGLFA
jgi:hypothetical protein